MELLFVLFLQCNFENVQKQAFISPTILKQSPSSHHLSDLFHHTVKERVGRDYTDVTT